MHLSRHVNILLCFASPHILASYRRPLNAALATVRIGSRLCENVSELSKLLSVET